ncbi:MAG: hypothetical protein GY696_39785, partial [Gammaproteobacteria bacterium]|nr:hypothetical protein [Gammaproteobacteria bacterium]
MAVVAHSVGASTIGCLKELHLDSRFSRSAWRAMLIKDNTGDLGILVAAWRRKQSNIENGIVKGRCEFLYYNLEKNESYEFTLPDANGNFTLKFDETCADMTTGGVSVGAEEQNITHKICLIFSVSTLFLLVQPYPDDLDRWNDNRTLAMEKRPHFVLANEIKLLLLCGWLQRMYLPTNKNLATREDRECAAGAAGRSRYLIMAGCGGYGYFDYHHHTITEAAASAILDSGGLAEIDNYNREDTNDVKNEHWIDKISMSEEEFELDNDNSGAPVVADSFGQQNVEPQQNFDWTAGDSDFTEGLPPAEDGGGWILPPQD